MDVMPIDLTAIIATIMGISIVLVPVIGLTARFALKPLAESLGHFFQSKNVEESVRILERRMALMEQHLESIETSLQRLNEAAEFHRDLHSGAPSVAGQVGAGVAGSHGQIGAGAAARAGGPVVPPGESRS
jgi:hypothetical protein